MSRLLGLREDQREGERLVALIAGLFASKPSWPIRRTPSGASPLLQVLPSDCRSGLAREEVGAANTELNPGHRLDH
jgi:hypothetical protein